MLHGFTAERFVRDCGLEVINILPFHRLGEFKWNQLGKEYAIEHVAGIELNQLEQADGRPSP